MISDVTHHGLPWLRGWPLFTPGPWLGQRILSLQYNCNFFDALAEFSGQWPGSVLEFDGGGCSNCNRYRIEKEARTWARRGAETGEFFHLSSFYCWPIFLFLSTMKEMVAFMKE